MKLLKGASLITLLLCGALFGFFYAWICSTMWGLDNIPPTLAIEAMQGMNASVRNAIFAPVFFGTSIATLALAGLAYINNEKRSSLLFLSAALIVFLGCQVLTFSINVQMNEALALISIDELKGAPERAAQIWHDYSPNWQFWNVIRTLFAGLALALVGMGLMSYQNPN